MAKLPERSDRIASAIYKQHETNAEDWRRLHLGASIIGTECSRALWYSFRWVSPPGFDGRMLRLFERGQREEDWVIEELTELGWEVKATDDDGNQWRFEEFGGHFGGSIDGAVLGVPGAEKTWHLLEVKTSNDRRFRTLQNRMLCRFPCTGRRIDPQCWQGDRRR